MSKLTPETVDDVARLAHLSLDEEERATFARQLEQILGYAASLQEVDTEEVPPMSHAGTRPALREDAAREGLPREQVLDQAPDPADGLFRVPRVLS